MNKYRKKSFKISFDILVGEDDYNQLKSVQQKILQDAVISYVFNDPSIGLKTNKSKIIAFSLEIGSGGSIDKGVTLETILESLQLGAKDSVTSTIEGIKSIFTKEGFHSLMTFLDAFGPGGNWSDEKWETKLSIAESINASIISAYNEFTQGDANVKAYYISSIGTDVFLTLIGTKGTQYASKTIKIGSSKAWSYLDEVTKNGEWKQILLDESGHIRIPGGMGNLCKRDALLNVVENQKLKNTINEMYRLGAQIGDGGLADVIRHELTTGELLSPNGHMQKGFERIKNLQNIIKTQNLSPSDIEIAEYLLKDLQDALKGVTP